MRSISSSSSYSSSPSSTVLPGVSTVLPRTLVPTLLPSVLVVVAVEGRSGLIMVERLAVRVAFPSAMFNCEDSCSLLDFVEPVERTLDPDFPLRKKETQR